MATLISSLIKASYVCFAEALAVPKAGVLCSGDEARGRETEEKTTGMRRSSLTRCGAQRKGILGNQVWEGGRDQAHPTASDMQPASKQLTATENKSNGQSESYKLKIKGPVRKPGSLIITFVEIVCC
ncbi:hypothetical protein Y1Q_0021328 [Alligator mississippiensis]|uniref:Secreted protein n=1 Tax=Alligator mississippiensis TaxID=8496 RepID=A0A151P9D8_ALLMI|nr:hypothetical protein Y1Q_0021328 [Alligator mississippiensis]